jgi:hypothetical protein
MELTREFDGTGVSAVVEPVWTTADQRVVPDIVLVEGEHITDIFEIKFVPFGYAKFESDLRKLLAYCSNRDVRYPVEINPGDGRWRDPIPIHPKCRGHFVAVAKSDAAAVWHIPLSEEFATQNGSHLRLAHWYGRVKDNDLADLDSAWSIDFDHATSRRAAGSES